MMNGKVCIVTGANSGIGMETVIGLTNQGAQVVMACRDLDRASAAQSLIRKESRSDTVDLLQLDLGSQESIRSFVEHFLKVYDRLDVLVNNAAVVPVKREETADGYEAQFGVNHLGPFLLTNLLLDTLKASAPSRVITVSSMLHVKGEINFDDLQSEESYGAMKAYNQSKLANMLFGLELSRRLEGTGVTSNVLHPGVVNTALSRNVPFFLKPLVKVAGLFMLKPDKGAATSLHVATNPGLETVTGKYFDECKDSRYSSKADDLEVAGKLWELSEEMTELG